MLHPRALDAFDHVAGGLAQMAVIVPATVIPEPTSLTLLTVGLGVLGLVGYGRHRQKRPRVPSSAAPSM